MKPRPYQDEAACAVLNEFQSVDSTLVVLPTGCGKTILFADLIARMFPRRALVLAHRQELIFQAKDKITRVTGLDCGIEMGDYRLDGNHSDDLFGGPHVIVSSIQTQASGGDGGGRMSKFLPENFGLVVIDEAHHATSSQYRRVVDYYRQNRSLKVLGVTATPDRADEQALGQIYDTVAYDYEVLDAINDGWLVPIEQQMVNVDGLDYSSIRTTAGDLNGGDLAKILEYEDNLHQMASPTFEIAGYKKTLVFTASVAQAERMAEIFNRHRSGCASWVCGKTPKEERIKILADFASGKIQFLCNCGVLTEGFDDPGVELVALARPTKSRSLYAQMIGRGTRPLPGVVDGPDTPDARKAAIAASAKPFVTILDFVGNCGRHKLVTSADILGGKVSDEAIDRAILKLKESGGRMRMDQVLEEAEAEVKEEKIKEEEAKRLKLQVKAKYKTSTVDPFDVFAITPQKERGWDKGKQLTEKQRNLLERQGIDPDSMPYSQSRQILNELFRRFDDGCCSYKMAKILKKYGLPTDCSMSVAGKLIDAIAQNGWKQSPGYAAMAEQMAISEQVQNEEVPF